MAVIKTSEAIGKRRGETKEDGTRTYVRVFYVETSAFGDSVLTVGAHPSIPALGSGYDIGTERDDAAIVRSIVPRQLASPFVWEVEVTNEARVGESEEPNDGDENPLNDPPEVSFGFRPETQALQTARLLDENGDPGSATVPTSSSGVPFEPGLTIERFDLVFRVVQNVALYDPVEAANWIGSVNSDPYPSVNGFSPRQLQITDFSGESQWAGFPYWRRTIEIVSRGYQSGSAQFEGSNGINYDFRLLDLGRYKLSGGQLQVIQDDDGRPVSEPVILNNGVPETVSATFSPTAGNYRIFRKYRERDFNELELFGAPAGS